MNKRLITGLVKHGDFILLDVALLQLCFVLSYWIGVQFSNPYSVGRYRYQAIIMLAAQLVVVLFSNNYHGILRRTWVDEVFATLSYITEVFMLSLVYMFVTHWAGMASRMQMGVTCLLFVGIDFLLRQANKRRIRRYVAKRGKKHSLVLVTSRDLVHNTIRQLSQTAAYQGYFVSHVVLMDDEDSGADVGAGVRAKPRTHAAHSSPLGASIDESTSGEGVEVTPRNIANRIPDLDSLAAVAQTANSSSSAATSGDSASSGFASTGPAPQRITEIEGIPVVPLDANAIASLTHGWVDEVFILQPSDVAFPTKFVDDLMQMGMTVSYAVSGEHLSVTDAGKVGPYVVLTSKIRDVSVGQLFVKRFADIVGGLVGCLLTAILTLIVGPIIYVKSPGPIFFKQTRVGLNGKPFTMYKFRSMYVDADERKEQLSSLNRMDTGLMFKVKNDPRIIDGHKRNRHGKPCGIGHFIRRYSIDEFPQFLNVLKGQMSLVGTRPPTLDEWERYDLEHRVRMSIKPGITGLWQVSGRSKITDFDQVVRLDREYIENWNLGMDVSILLKTVVVVIGGRGAL